MGNKMCKKKSDALDGGENLRNEKKSPWKLGNIINRFNLKPTAWKSESHLNQKQATRLDSDATKEGESIFYTKPLSKSSDWTQVDLEVPCKEDDHIHLRNPKLSLIFDKEDGTPTPPPRKHQKGNNLREKFEKLAKSGLQAIQGDKNNQKPVEEPLVVKKKINYVCPTCDSDEHHHNRDHHHHDKSKKSLDSNKSKDSKRKKNLSVVSLPNYTDLKLSVVSSERLDHKSTSKGDLNSSRLSLQGLAPKKITSSSSTGRLDSYITRCRSFGSIFPQQLKKLRSQKVEKKEDVTSDDSFGPLEDWDLGLIEHYNPKDASLPRPRKPALQKPSDDSILSGIESLVVKEEDLEKIKPKPPVRRNESLIKKSRKGDEQGNVVRKAPDEVCLTPPPSPVTNKPKDECILKEKPPVPAKRFLKEDEQEKVKPDKKEELIETNNIKQGKNEDKVEHSSLMRILQEFSIKDKEQERNGNIGNESNFSSLTPSLVEFEKNLNSNNVVEDFINAEKTHTRAVLT